MSSILLLHINLSIRTLLNISFIWNNSKSKSIFENNDILFKCHLSLSYLKENRIDFHLKL